MKDISPKLIEKTRIYLGEDGLDFFTEIYQKHGKLNAVLTGSIPHPVHLREGMTIRNFMRSTGLCENWNAYDYDNNWERLVILALEL